VGHPCPTIGAFDIHCITRLDGHYRKYLSRLHERLGEARLNVVGAFERIGLDLFLEPADGMFIWARFPHIEDSLALAEASQRDGIMLRQARSSARTSSARHGCGSTSQFVTMCACSAGCSGRSGAIAVCKRPQLVCGADGTSFRRARPLGQWAEQRRYDRATNAHFRPVKAGGATGKSLIVLNPWLTLNQRVPGSSPGAPTKSNKSLQYLSIRTDLLVWRSA